MFPFKAGGAVKAGGSPRRHSGACSHKSRLSPTKSPGVSADLGVVSSGPAEPTLPKSAARGNGREGPFPPCANTAHWKADLGLIPRLVAGTEAPRLTRNPKGAGCQPSPGAGGKQERFWAGCVGKEQKRLLSLAATSEGHRPSVLPQEPSKRSISFSFSFFFFFLKQTEFANQFLKIGSRNPNHTRLSFLSHITKGSLYAGRRTFWNPKIAGASAGRWERC